jgi:myo-inositol-1(or 4)-monophosphatase
MLGAVTPEQPSDRALLEVATTAARAACEVLRESFGSLTLEVRAKAHNDLVSSADHAAEAAIVEVIRGRFPDAAFLAEEGGRSGNPASELEWLIDPLDGTNNFLQGLPIFATSIACRRRGVTVVGVVAEPITGVVYSAQRGEGAWRDGLRLAVSQREGLEGAFLATGFPFRAHASLGLYMAALGEIFLQTRAVRRCGSAALDLAYTAAGIYDGFFEFRLSPWDIAAGALLVEEAGGVVTDLDGGRDPLGSGNVLAGGRGVWRELRAVVGRHADEARLDALEHAGAVVS